jgi:hypothetical protein
MFGLYQRFVLAIVKVFVGFGVLYYHSAHLLFTRPETPYEGFITHTILIITLLAGLVVGIEGLRELYKILKRNS